MESICILYPGLIFIVGSQAVIFASPLFDIYAIMYKLEILCICYPSNKLFQAIPFVCIYMYPGKCINKNNVFHKGCKVYCSDSGLQLHLDANRKTCVSPTYWSCFIIASKSTITPEFKLQVGAFLYSCLQPLGMLPL